jgi:hypothetical protein
MVEGVKMKCLKIHNAAGFLFIMIIPLLFIQGCIMLPIPSEKVIAGHQMTNKELNFIRPGITTKEEVVERLDDPDMIWQEERIFAYNWQTTWGVLLWVVAAGYGYGDYGAEDIGQKNYVLLIRFDPNDRVERFEATKRSKSDSYGEHLKKWIKKIKNTPATEVPL